MGSWQESVRRSDFAANCCAMECKFGCITRNVVCNAWCSCRCTARARCAENASNHRYGHGVR
eukprot:216449-Lingulodinium_polyedra.AAC.1